MFISCLINIVLLSQEKEQRGDWENIYGRDNFVM